MQVQHPSFSISDTEYSKKIYYGYFNTLIKEDRNGSPYFFISC